MYDGWRRERVSEAQTIILSSVKSADWTKAKHESINVCLEGQAKRRSGPVVQVKDAVRWAVDCGDLERASAPSAWGRTSLWGGQLLPSCVGVWCPTRSVSKTSTLWRSLSNSRRFVCWMYRIVVVWTTAATNPSVPETEPLKESHKSSLHLYAQIRVWPSASKTLRRRFEVC